MTAAAPVEVVSFGYLHGLPPAAHLTYDVREHFRDPHFDPAQRELTAADEAVRRSVLGMPGVPRLIGSVAASVLALLDAPSPGPVRVAVGCAGGRHRSAVIAEEAAAVLRAAGVPVTLVHRDIGRPVVRRGT